MTPNRCETCRHFSASPDCSNLGDCRRFPPVLTIGSTVARFPIVSVDSVCGEFGQAGSDPQQASTAIDTAARLSDPEPAAALASATPEVRDRVLKTVRAAAPLTACRVAQFDGLPLAEVERAVDELKRDRQIVEWVDRSEYGDGRTFLGPPWPTGLDEPAPREEPTAPPKLDPRTLLSFARRCATPYGVKQHAQKMGVKDERVREAAEQLRREGHAEIHKPKTTATLIPTSYAW